MFKPFHVLLISLVCLFAACQTASVETTDYVNMKTDIDCTDWTKLTFKQVQSGVCPGVPIDDPYQCWDGSFTWDQVQCPPPPPIADGPCSMCPDTTCLDSITGNPADAGICTPVRQPLPDNSKRD